MKTGVELIQEERDRQIGYEGWDIPHDDMHTDGSLARAAACYAMPNFLRKYSPIITPATPLDWPWDVQWWKPSPHERIRELQKAGALIAAEIDRLNRLKND